jgi:polyphosphate kinase 2 (PPK2 family)
MSGGSQPRLYVALSNLKCMPERERIGIFNCSYYEESLVVRVHSELMARQKIPKQLMTKNIWEERDDDIRNIERYFSRDGGCRPLFPSGQTF